MTILARSWQHSFAGTSRSRRRTHPIPSQRLQAPAGHHRPVLDQAVEYGTSGQSAIISGFQLSAILGKPSLAKAAATPNPHRRPSSHCFPAGSFFGGFRTPALYRVDRSRRGRHPKPFSRADLAAIAADRRGSTPQRSLVALDRDGERTPLAALLDSRRRLVGAFRCARRKKEDCGPREKMPMLSQLREVD